MSKNNVMSGVSSTRRGGYIKRVEIYPTIKMAKMAFDEKVESLGNNLKAFDKRNLTVYNFNGQESYFFGNIDYLRGHRFDEIYIHPNVKDRKTILEGTVFINCKIVYKI